MAAFPPLRRPHLAPPAPPFSSAPVAANKSRRSASSRADRNARRAQTRAALSGTHDDIAHRLAGFDRFMRGGDLAEIEGLRHVVDELVALQHARDVAVARARSCGGIM